MSDLGGIRGPVGRQIRQILVADQDATSRDNLGALLRDGGYRVRKTADLDQASHMLDVHHYDLALLDIGADAGESLAFIRDLRAHDGDDRTPIALVAESASTSSAVDAIRLSVLDYLVKPVDPADLLRRVSSAVSRGRLARKLAVVREELATLRAMVTTIEASAAAVHPRSAKERMAMALDELTSRERSVVSELAWGLSTNQIASKLRISPHTVRNHLKSAYKKFGVKTRSGLMKQLLDAPQVRNVFVSVD